MNLSKITGKAGLLNTPAILKTTCAFVVLGFFTACSGDNDDDNSYSSSSSSVAEASSSSSSEESATTEENIVEVAVANGSFTTFVTALQAAGLDDDLADENASFTVFAPTDAAFEELRSTMSDEEWDALLASDDLASILLYHVVSGEISAEQAIAADGSLIETLNGNNVAVGYVDGSVTVADATVVSADVGASNGVIHVIDTVIMPPSGTITDLVVEGEQFATLETAVTTAGLGDTLAGDGPFTVFAPTDAAFAKLGEETIAAILADNDLLTDILTYHVIGSTVSAKQAIDLSGSAATMLNDEDADINLVDSSLYIDRAKVSVTNIVATNGVVHVIDSVMKPDEVSAPDGDIVAVLAADDNFTTLVTAVTTAGLVETLQGEGPFTVFAPTDAVFEALPDGTLADLLADPEALGDILTYHVFAGSVDAAAAVAADGASLTMVNGSDAAVAVVDGAVTIAGATVIMTDVETSNGIIHVIDAVMIPQ